MVRKPIWNVQDMPTELVLLISLGLPLYSLELKILSFEITKR
jgi:hypothetical protein